MLRGPDTGADGSSSEMPVERRLRASGDESWLIQGQLFEQVAEALEDRPVVLSEHIVTSSFHPAGHHRITAPISAGSAAGSGTKVKSALRWGRSCPVPPVPTRTPQPEILEYRRAA
jgi:hypothetical protein